MEEQYPNITIEELSMIENVSYRTKTVCKINNLTDLNSIMKFYYHNDHFLLLKCSSQKTNDELIAVCRKFKQLRNKNTAMPVSQKNELAVMINNLTELQKKILNNKIWIHVKDLGVRSLNGLKMYLKHDFSIEGLSPYLPADSIQFRNLWQVGEKAESEIYYFLHVMKGYLKDISTYDSDESLYVELVNSAVERRFKVDSKFIYEIWDGYDPKKGTPVFRICDILIESDYGFIRKKREIFKKSFNFYNNRAGFSFKKVSSAAKLTQERVRQIRKEIFYDLDSIFSFINYIDIKYLNLYDTDTGADLVMVSDDTVKQINKEEKNSFNRIFIIKILSIILKNTHCLIGNEEALVLGKTKGLRHQWKSLYLIRKEITDVFDFEKFVNDISKRLRNRIVRDYRFGIKDYMTRFSKTGKLTRFPEIYPIIEHILLTEFQSNILINEEIVFQRTTRRKVCEYAYEALERLGKPSKVGEIYEKVKELNPDYKTSELSISQSMKIKDGFIYFGRSGVYGLKTWEKEKDLKGGTIRDLVEEYLQKHDEPMHITDITKYVVRYRETNSNSIYYNIRSAKDRFRFFRVTLVGLRNKVYERDREAGMAKMSTVRRTWEKSLQLLRSFALENNRLPSYSGNAEEIRLARFYYIQTYNMRKGLLDEDRTGKFKQLMETLPEKKNMYGRRKITEHESKRA